MQSRAQSFTEAEQTFLLDLARASIAAYTKAAREPELDAARITPSLQAQRSCFVTLQNAGSLRGCVGNLTPRGTLYAAVMDNARGAAFRDTRFAPVELDEIPKLDIEISVLSLPEQLLFGSPEELLGKLRPGEDGVVLNLGGRTVTFLPQVWRKFPEPSQFLTALARKAMLPHDAWRDPEATVMAYQVESFGTPHAE